MERRWRILHNAAWVDPKPRDIISAPKITLAVLVIHGMTALGGVIPAPEITHAF
jgi:hypothetical protein